MMRRDRCSKRSLIESGMRSLLPDRSTHLISTKEMTMLRYRMRKLTFLLKMRS